MASFGQRVCAGPTQPGYHIVAGTILAILVIAGFAHAELPADDPAFHPGPFHCPPTPPECPDFTEAIAWLEFPRFNLTVPVFEGVEEPVLRRGAGHVIGTAWPGVPDPYRNCVVAAHRTSFFSPLESVVPGDIFTMITGAGAEEFIVDRILVVTPEHVELEAPTRARRLTLVTCTPFNYLGSAPRRLVVLASPHNTHRGRSRPTKRAPATGGRRGVKKKVEKRADGSVTREK